MPIAFHVSNGEWISNMVAISNGISIALLMHSFVDDNHQACVFENVMVDVVAEFDFLSG